MGDAGHSEEGIAKLDSLRVKRSPRAWRVAPLAIMWVIWKERNGEHLKW